MIRVALHVRGTSVDVSLSIRHLRLRRTRPTDDNSSWHMRCKIVELCSQVHELKERHKKELRVMQQVWKLRLDACNARCAKMQIVIDRMRADRALFTIRTIVSAHSSPKTMVMAAHWASAVIELEELCLRFLSIQHVLIESLQLVSEMTTRLRRMECRRVSLISRV